MEENRAFSEANGFEFALLCDTDRTMGLAYGATEEGSSRGANRIGVVIDTEGKVIAYEPSAGVKDFPHQALALL